eukprot:CAMPEP_0174912536 /NCGR_PEP_ID=MMETSP0167-20121228/79836_1 /TAXON_ID=38298 /ORGANISM="Rhodella maculata, Strain CCMP736" /LENGTH=691 /DNA_ID=CAMNT_0016157195 /DNA_START=28 /DNA_END=2103 /DNA_ORIENTATION=+
MSSPRPSYKLSVGFGGKTYDLSLPQDSSVKDLRAALSAILSQSSQALSDSAKVVIKGKVRHDSLTLSDCGIEAEPSSANANKVMILQSAKSAAPRPSAPPEELPGGEPEKGDPPAPLVVGEGQFAAVVSVPKKGATRVVLEEGATFGDLVNEVGSTAEYVALFKGKKRENDEKMLNAGFKSEQKIMLMQAQRSHIAQNISALHAKATTLRKQALKDAERWLQIRAKGLMIYCFGRGLLPFESTMLNSILLEMLMQAQRSHIAQNISALHAKATTLRKQALNGVVDSAEVSIRASGMEEEVLELHEKLRLGGSGSDMESLRSSLKDIEGILKAAERGLGSKALIVPQEDSKKTTLINKEEGRAVSPAPELKENLVAEIAHHLVGMDPKVLKGENIGVSTVYAQNIIGEVISEIMHGEHGRVIDERQTHALDIASTSASGLGTEIISDSLRMLFLVNSKISFNVTTSGPPSITVFPSKSFGVLATFAITLATSSTNTGCTLLRPPSTTATSFRAWIQRAPPGEEAVLCAEDVGGADDDGHGVYFLHRGLGGGFGPGPLVAGDGAGVGAGDVDEVGDAGGFCGGGGGDGGVEDGVGDGGFDGGVVFADEVDGDGGGAEGPREGFRVLGLGLHGDDLAEVAHEFEVAVVELVAAPRDDDLGPDLAEVVDNVAPEEAGGAKDRGDDAGEGGAAAGA